MLHVATQALDRFGEVGFTQAEEAGRSIRPEKVVAESALLTLAASTVQDPVVEGLVADLVDRLEPMARGDRTLLAIALEPAAAWDYAQAHVFLTRLGRPDISVDVMLKAAATSQVAGVREHPPHRTLELEWLRRTGPGAADAPHELHSGNGALARPLDLFGGTREDLYAFTHALMYVGDFAIHPSPWPRSTADICAEADGALARCLDDQDYDLAGEVLLAWPLTGVPWSPTATFAFRVLAAVENEAGFLPSHSIDLDRLQTLEGNEHTDLLLGSTYHTIYVMGLLCSAALQPGQTPPLSVPDHLAVRGAADHFLPFLDTGSTRPHWMSTYATLGSAERDALAPFLFTVAAVRSVRARQFAALRTLLATCHRLGLAHTPSASQAAELLDRLATFTELVAASQRRAQAAGPP